MSQFEWIFKITDQASGTAAKIASSINSLKSSIDKVGGSLSNLGKEHKKAGEAAEESKKHHESLLGELLKFETIKEVAHLVVEGIEKIGESLIEADKGANIFERSLKRFGATGEEAREIIERFEKNSNLGEKAKDFGAALGFAGYRAKELSPLLASLADVKSIGGDPERALQAYVKLGTGLKKLSSGDLVAFKITAEDVAKTLGNGAKTADVENLLKSKDITKVGNTLIETMKRVNEGKLGLVAGGDLDLGDIVDKFTILKNDIAETFAASPEFKQFKQDLFDFVHNLGTKENIDAFIGALQTTLSVIKALLPIIIPVTAAFVAMGIAASVAGAIAAGAFILALSPVILTVGAVTLAIASVGAAVYEIVENWNELKWAVGAAWDAVVIAAEGIWTSIKSAFSAAGSVIWDFIKWYYTLPIRFFEGAIEIGSSLMSGIVEGLTKGISYVKDALAKVTDSIKETFKDLLGIHSPSTVFAEFGMYSAQGFGQGLKDGMLNATTGVSIPVDNMVAQGGTSGGNGSGMYIESVTFGDINIGSGEHDGSEQAMGDAIMSRIKDELGSLISPFERLAQEQGVM